MSCAMNRKSDKKGKRFVRKRQTWPSTNCGKKKKQTSTDFNFPFTAFC